MHTPETLDAIVLWDKRAFKLQFRKLILAQQAKKRLEKLAAKGEAKAFRNLEKVERDLAVLSRDLQERRERLELRGVDSLAALLT